MLERAEIARRVAVGLEAFAPQARDVRVMVGFDGFADSIIHIVDKRTSPFDYEPIATMSRFAEKIAAAAGKSSNYELITAQQKLGGNGPIMANALVAAGAKVTYVGGIGRPAIHPSFQEFADRCESCLSLADPGFTDALEFADGKLMMGKHENTKLVNPDAIKEQIGTDRMIEIFQQSKLVAMVNWTMLLYTSDIWKYLLADVFPKVQWGQAGKQFVFIDLTDPEKRTTEALVEAVGLLQQMEKYTNVVLGLNYKEAQQVAAALNLAVTAHSEVGIEELAQAIRSALDLHGVCVHPRAGAAACMKTDQGVRTASFEGPYVQKPKLSTGAGDNFNAGFCLGLLADMGLEECLCAGTATSGLYVRQAASPTVPQLIEFCKDLPLPEKG